MNPIIANEHNKKKCQKFTPQNVVKDMLDLAGYTHGLSGKTVLEYSLELDIIKRNCQAIYEDALAQNIPVDLFPQDCCRYLRH